jgi:methyl-accepting chemotaxis protein
VARYFAGFGIAGFVAICASLGGVGTIAVQRGLAEIDRRSSASLAADLEERVRAGRAALEALEEAQSDLRKVQDDLQQGRRSSLRTRAFEAVLSGGAVKKVDGLVGTGIIDANADRVISSTWAGLVRGATVSKALPVLAQQLAKSAGPAIVEDDRGVLAVSPRDSEGRAQFARVESSDLGDARERASLAALLRAESTLANLAEPPAPFVPPKDFGVGSLIGALAGALIGFLWGRWRLGRPLAKTLDAARAFVHGEHGARADVERGGRDARNVARAVNALIESAERFKVQGRAAREEDVRKMSLAIEAIGQGDLSSSAPVVGEALEPIHSAIVRARKDMLEWITEINRVSLEVASNAADVVPGAKKIAQASVEQLEALKDVAKNAGEASEEVKATTVRLGYAVGELGSFAEGERKTARDMQTSLKAASRRAQDLKQGAARLESLAATAESIEDAIDVLAQTANPDNPPSPSRVLTAVGEGRAAMEALSRELALLREEMGQLATSLETIAASVPESPAELASAVTGNLHDAATALLHIAERGAGGLKALERSARTIAEGAEQIRGGAAVASDLAPRLGGMLAHFSVGSSFEKELMERIERWRKEAEDAASAPDGLTEDGRLMLKQVAEASEVARHRLARLVSVTEAAVDVLRG